MSDVLAGTQDPFAGHAKDPYAEARMREIYNATIKPYAMVTYSGSTTAGSTIKLPARHSKGDVEMVGTNGVVILRDGLYDITYNVGYEPSATAGARGARLAFNDFATPQGIETVHQAANATTWAGGSAITVPLKAGDSIDLEFYSELATVALGYAYLTVAMR